MICKHNRNSRGTSTKTRIETVPRRCFRSSGIIQEAHPLKQGLKPYVVNELGNWIAIQEAHPLKQGLKPQQGINIGTVGVSVFKRHIH